MIDKEFWDKIDHLRINKKKRVKFTEDVRILSRIFGSASCTAQPQSLRWESTNGDPQRTE